MIHLALGLGAAVLGIAFVSVLLLTIQDGVSLYKDFRGPPPAPKKKKVIKRYPVVPRKRKGKKKSKY